MNVDDREQNKSTLIKEMPPMERPREKLLLRGAGSLSDAELLAVILGSGTRTLTILELCGQLMDALDGDLSKITQVDVQFLKRMNGIGEVRAVTLLAIVALAGRLNEIRDQQAAAVLDDRGITTLLRPIFSLADRPRFLVLLLTADNRLLATAELTVPDAEFPDISNLVKLTVGAGAIKFVLVRNGSVGETMLRDDEKSYLLKLRAAAEMLSVSFERLIVFSGDSFYKFVRNADGDFIEMQLSV